MQALEIITQALNVANQKGAFTLQESATIFTALNQLTAIINSPLKEVEDLPKESK